MRWTKVGQLSQIKCVLHEIITNSTTKTSNNIRHSMNMYTGVIPSKIIRNWYQSIHFLFSVTLGINGRMWANEPSLIKRVLWKGPFFRSYFIKIMCTKMTNTLLQIKVICWRPNTRESNYREWLLCLMQAPDPTGPAGSSWYQSLPLVMWRVDRTR
jgi:hypothetical protein